MAITKLDGPYRPPATERAGSAVILLHGLGADGNDLFDLAGVIAANAPDAAVYAPHAPFACDMAPVGRQWFSLQERTPAFINSGVRTAAPILDAFIDEVATREGLPFGRIALFGFSQGCMLALHVAPRRSEALAAVLGYSGALVSPDTLVDEARSRPPIYLAHGDADMVVPFMMLDAATRTLQAAAFDVTAMARPGLGHGIDPEGLNAGMTFLRHALDGDSRAV